MSRVRIKSTRVATFGTILLVFITSLIYLLPKQNLASAPSTTLVYGENGLVKGWDEAHTLLKQGGFNKRDMKWLKGITTRHPILDLIKNGRTKWEALLAR